VYCHCCPLNFVFFALNTCGYWFTESRLRCATVLVRAIVYQLVA
jgi:hypothetical protein